MEYRITKQQLENDLLYDTLAALKECMDKHNLPLCIVGAQARDIALKICDIEESIRRTMDLDVAIAVENWQMFEQISQTLESKNFKRIARTQKFVYLINKYEVDIVPFDGVAKDEKICWPPDGNPVMSVKGFKNIMQASDTIVIDNSIIIRIPTLCGLFFTKLDAWIDRHDSTDKDACDMLFIIQNYFTSQINSNIIPPKIIDLSTDDNELEILGAQWLAYDAKKILTIEQIDYFNNLIFNELKMCEKSELIKQLIKNYKISRTYETGRYDEIYYDKSCEILKNLVEVLSKDESY